MRGVGGRAAGLVVLALAWLPALVPPARAEGDGVVRAILFVSPTCPHCHKVREEVLPALAERFGGGLQVGIVSTTTPAGRDLYWAAYHQYGVKLRGVPLLVVGDFALVGSDEIPRRLPGIVSGYLASGGVPWPSLPGLDTLVAAATPAPTPAPVPTPTPEEAAPAPTAPAVAPAPRGAPVIPPPAALPLPPPPPQPENTSPAAGAPSAAHTSPKGASTPSPPVSPSPAAPVTVAARPSSPPAPTVAPTVLLAAGADEESPGVVARVLADPQGNGLAIVVLVAMIGVVLRSLVALRRPVASRPTRPLDWLTPVLALAGLGVASYLAHVEVRGVEAVCGPVGDCNTVQQSEWARLFGVVPIGVLGVLGFTAILIAWGVRRFGARPISSWASFALLAMTGLGTLFSIYLTFLEPFVIGATCLWCLSSAVIMTTLHGLAREPGRAAAADVGLLAPARQEV